MTVGSNVNLIRYILISFIVLQTFSPLIDKHGLSEREHPVPVEFVGDHERCEEITIFENFWTAYSKYI